VTLSPTNPDEFAILVIDYSNNNLSGESDMNPFVKFMASGVGRLVRIVAGIALVVWGLWGLGGAAGIIVAVIGAVPLVAGLFDFCVFAPLFNAPFWGAKIRGGK
jgi:hypothetical protein